MIEITRRLEIDAGHRLMQHESKCRNVHGHRYAFEITVGAEALDEVGRVIDFGKVKQIVGGWLDDNWDHAMIVQEGDPIVDWLKANDQKLYVIASPPSAENLARYFLLAAAKLLAVFGIRVISVRCYETPNCWSDCWNG